MVQQCSVYQLKIFFEKNETNLLSLKKASFYLSKYCEIDVQEVYCTSAVLRILRHCYYRCIHTSAFLSTENTVRYRIQEFLHIYKTGTSSVQNLRLRNVNVFNVFSSWETYSFITLLVSGINAVLSAFTFLCIRYMRSWLKFLIKIWKFSVT